MKLKNVLGVLCVLALGARSARGENAAAALKATAEGSPVAGTVTLQETKDGLKISAKLTGVPAGDHGFHIHEFGDCGDSGKKAGGHYNPRSTKHGHLMKEGARKAHAGDMGNISADKDGNAALEVVLPRQSVSSGKYNVAGRAIILHEKVDDFSQPTGNAGGRIGCGVIMVVGQ